LSLPQGCRWRSVRVIWVCRHRGWRHRIKLCAKMFKFSVMAAVGAPTAAPDPGMHSDSRPHPWGRGKGPGCHARACAPTLKTRCLDTPTGANHNRTHLLRSLLHCYYGAATPKTYCFILSCPQPNLLLGRQPPPIPRRRLPRLSKRAHANTGHPEHLRAVKQKLFVINNVVAYLLLTGSAIPPATEAGPPTPAGPSGSSSSAAPSGSPTSIPR
jgi:hypothetical protein